jgi:dipeptidyl aminopeptidase/acylaminoacyl peptidase
VLRAGRIVRAELGNVRCRTLVMHGHLDRVCPVANAEAFASALGTLDVEVAILPRSGHILSDDVDRSEVANTVDAFLTRIARPSGDHPWHLRSPNR